MNNKPIVFLDLDNVLADFDNSPDIPEADKEQYNHPNIYKKGFFYNLPVMPGAIEFVEKLLKSDKFDLHVLTQPVSGSSHSYRDKVIWVKKYFPQLVNKITMTQDKTMLRGEILIDDNPKWQEFKGKFILFNYKTPEKEFAKIKEYLFYMYGEV